MRKLPFATIVNFCTNEARYLKACLEEASLFSRQVIVPVADHFFDGTKENETLLKEIYAAFPECLFIEYPFIAHHIPPKKLEKWGNTHFWHNLSRLIGTHFLDETIETVLFLDADEIVEGEKFKEWLIEGNYHEHTAIKLANYWYFREPTHQALQWEDSPVIVQKKILSQDILLNPEERQAIFDHLPKPKERMVAGFDGAPMIHHYSWVRTEAEMLKKVESWGHKQDRDWTRLVKEEFSHPFQGVDFVHGYTFREVLPPFMLETPTYSPKGPPNVKRLEEKEVLKLIRQKRFLRFLSF